MEEKNVMDLLEIVRTARGKEYAQGMVDMANLLTTPAKPEEPKPETRPA